MSAELIRPILTVDLVIFTLRGGRLHVGLQKREWPPFAERRALVGGYVHPEEDSSTAAAAARVLRDKAGLTARLLEQLMTFSGAGRDPRGWSASVAYCALLPEHEAEAGVNLEWSSVEGCRGLPFDHDAIVAAAAERCRRRASYTTLPAFLLPAQFTLTELRRAYESVLGRELNDSAFRRKIDELRLIEPLVGAESRATARPAQMYRLAQPAGAVEFDRTL